MREPIERPRRRVVVLGGWSPGPLGYLERELPEFEFVPVSIPMPPCGCLWLANPFVALLVAFFAVGAPWLGELAVRAEPPGVRWLLVVACIGACIVVARFLVAGVVRFAIWHGGCAAQRAISATKKSGGEPCLVIGFSWGGGVLHFLLASGGWRGPALLLAPTTSAMCGAALVRPWPPLAASAGERTEVVHAIWDGFCPPAQEQLYRDAGCTVCRVDSVSSERAERQRVACPHAICSAEYPPDNRCPLLPRHLFGGRIRLPFRRKVRTVRDEHVLCARGTLETIVTSLTSLADVGTSAET